MNLIAARSALGESGEETTRSLVKLLHRSLKVVASPMAKQLLNSRDVLLAMNALGQIARAWDWLGMEMEENTPEELRRSILFFCELARLDILLEDAYTAAGKTSGDHLSPRDLALMLLALLRVARRLRALGSDEHGAALPPLAELLCQRLKQAAEHRASRSTTLLRPSEEELKQIEDEAMASLSAASLMLRHCAKDAGIHSMTDESSSLPVLPVLPLDVIMTWSKAAFKLGLSTGQESYKALAAATAASEANNLTLLTSEGAVELRETLGWLLRFATKIDEDGENANELVSQMENWHLDSSLHALALLESLSFEADWLPSLQDATLKEVKQRLPKLRKSSIMFWKRFWDLIPPTFAQKLALHLAEDLSSRSQTERLPKVLRVSVEDFLRGKKSYKKLPLYFA